MMVRVECRVNRAQQVVPFLVRVYIPASKYTGVHKEQGVIRLQYVTLIGRGSIAHTPGLVLSLPLPSLLKLCSASHAESDDDD